MHPWARNVPVKRSIRSALNEFAESYKPAEVAAEEVGHVVFAADGIAHVEGLPGVMANELLTFEDGTAGLAMNLEERKIEPLSLPLLDPLPLFEPSDPLSVPGTSQAPALAVQGSVIISSRARSGGTAHSMEPSAR